MKIPYSQQKSDIFGIISRPLVTIRVYSKIKNTWDILDYKPGANKLKPIDQLTTYALALSRKLNLPLYYFKCAWFDENNYFEFFPLHVVYENKNRKINKYQ